MSESQVIAAHEAAGHYFDADGIRSFVLDEGEGPAVLLLHGVPSSSFLYRKVVPALAERGLRGIAFDLPGLGLADRPADHDYSWSGLGRFAVEAVDALGLDRFHLVVHDIGGPVGFELATAMPDRIQSLTILNTLIDVAAFTKPWSMRPFEWPTLGRLWLTGMSRPAFRFIMRLQGIGDMAGITTAEMNAYLGLLKRIDGGAAFLRIMRSFETTPEKQALYRSAVQHVPYPVQVIWGEDDPALKVDTHGETARSLAGVDEIHRLPGKHFVQEDQPLEIAELIAGFTSR